MLSFLIGRRRGAGAAPNQLSPGHGGPPLSFVKFVICGCRQVSRVRVVCVSILSTIKFVVFGVVGLSVNTPRILTVTRTYG